MSDWREWVAGVPEGAFPLTPDGLLQWLRASHRVPPLYWDQFRTRLFTVLSGEEWETREGMLQDLERVDWGF
jgi:hypothetical protein